MYSFSKKHSFGNQWIAAKQVVICYFFFLVGLETCKLQSLKFIAKISIAVSPETDFKIHFNKNIHNFQSDNVLKLRFFFLISESGEKLESLIFFFISLVSHVLTFLSHDPPKSICTIQYLSQCQYVTVFSGCSVCKSCLENVFLRCYSLMTLEPYRFFWY